jgi:hypothetical protein
LADALQVPLRERNALLLAAGFAPIFRESNLDDPALEPVRRAIDAFSPSSGCGRDPKGDRRVAHPLPSSAGPPVARTAAQAGREHLDTLRAADPTVKLAAAQHALAREYGFESWPRLVHHVDSLQPASRMLRPAALRSDEKLLWSPGRGPICGR